MIIMTHEYRKIVNLNKQDFDFRMLLPTVTANSLILEKRILKASKVNLPVFTIIFLLIKNQLSTIYWLTRLEEKIHVWNL